MKTTVEISDSLLAEVRSLAESKGGTLRNLKFRLKDGSVGGKGVRPGLDWPGMLDTIYKGRGN